MSRGKAKTGKEALTARQLEYEVHKRRLQSKTFHEIARELSVSEQGAYNAVNRVLKRIVSKTDEWSVQEREIKAQQIEVTLRELNEQIEKEGITPGLAMAKFKGIDTFIKIYGLNKPVQVQVTGKNGGPIQLSATTGFDVSKLNDEQFNKLQELMAIMEQEKTPEEIQQEKMQAAGLIIDGELESGT